MPLQRNKLIFALLTTLLLGGCTVIKQLQDGSSANATTGDTMDSMNTTETMTIRDTPIKQPAKTKKMNIDWLLRYYRHASSASAKVLTDEYQRTKKDFSENQTEKNQWRLAILLSIPGTAFHDAERSSILFKELTNDKLERDPVLNNAAFLMHSLLNEQHHISRKSNSLAEQLVESQSANKKLQEQLDALKAIEDTLYERNKTEVTPKP